MTDEELTKAICIDRDIRYLKDYLNTITKYCDGTISIECWHLFQNERWQNIENCLSIESYSRLQNLTKDFFKRYHNVVRNDILEKQIIFKQI